MSTRWGASLLALAACSQNVGPYVARPGSEASLPLTAAQRDCAQQAEFQTLDASRQMDWEAYRHCMSEHGWILESEARDGS